MRVRRRLREFAGRCIRRVRFLPGREGPVVVRQGRDTRHVQDLEQAGPDLAPARESLREA